MAIAAAKPGEVPAPAGSKTFYLNNAIMADAGRDRPAVGTSGLSLTGYRLDGDTEKRTAERLGLSPHTVHTYLWRIYRKLQVQSREELLVRVFAEFRSLPKRGSTRGKRQDGRRRRDVA